LANKSAYLPLGIQHSEQYHTSELLVLLDLISLKHTLLSDTIP